jgi:hypothetical protein
MPFGLMAVWKQAEGVQKGLLERVALRSSLGYVEIHCNPPHCATDLLMSSLNLLRRDGFEEESPVAQGHHMVALYPLYGRSRLAKYFISKSQCEAYVAYIDVGGSSALSWPVRH